MLKCFGVLLVFGDLNCQMGFGVLKLRFNHQPILNVWIGEFIGENGENDEEFSLLLNFHIK